MCICCTSVVHARRRKAQCVHIRKECVCMCVVKFASCNVWPQTTYTLTHTSARLAGLKKLPEAAAAQLFQQLLVACAFAKKSIDFEAKLRIYSFFLLLRYFSPLVLCLRDFSGRWRAMSLLSLQITTCATMKADRSLAWQRWRLRSTRHMYESR